MVVFWTIVCEVHTWPDDYINIILKINHELLLTTNYNSYWTDIDTGSCYLLTSYLQLQKEIANKELQWQCIGKYYILNKGIR